MKIKIFANKNYLTTQYEMSEETICRFNLEVLPNLMNRLAMDSRVELVEIYTNEPESTNIGFSSKLKRHIVGTDNIKSFAELIDLCKVAEENQIIVVYNPLFPFISLDKIYGAYRQVVDGRYESAFGVYDYYAEEISDSNLESMDLGIFSIFKADNFLKKKRRVLQPTKPIKLSAIELISLRQKDDYELYGLVVNSGLMQ